MERRAVSKLRGILHLVVSLASLTACREPQPVSDVVDAGSDADATSDAQDAGQDVARDVFTLPDGAPPMLQDQRTPCAARTATRVPLFGDLHVHTVLSFDVWQAGVRNTPADAYRFAKGEAVQLPPLDANGQGTRSAQLARPLDFAAVTDHSEFLGEIDLCTDPTSAAYNDVMCIRYRASLPADRFFGGLSLVLASRMPQRHAWCFDHPGACLERAYGVWQEVQQAAEAVYDRSAACRFTSFVGYEWTGTSGGFNLHRNVIFKNRQVPWVPTTYIEAPTAERLWAQLDGMCRNAGTGCDVLSIPHNSNLGGDRMFLPTTDDGAAYTRAQSQRRAAIEPLVEVFQHKGSSECLTGWPDPLSVQDELCRFEALTPSICTGGPGDAPNCVNVCIPGATLGGFANPCVAKNGTVRGALGSGLAERVRTGANPFELGMISSTDTHNGTPGATGESTWQGHLGIADDDPAEKFTAINRYYSPGGLAVVWAEENSRDAIFDALRRRETYATSGTRPIVRFFGGWQLDAGLCGQADLATNGYAQGVPMGSVLPTRPSNTTAPRFALAAWKDPGTTSDAGQRLQRLQIVKGWVDTQGNVREQVLDVAGDAANGASVDAQCNPTGPGADSLCTVWTDPSFDPTVPAYYYARVVENPTCRWSARVCAAAQPDCATLPATDPLRACCDNALPRTLQERAWTSPIWYYPNP